MSLSGNDVEERLTFALHMFAETVPDDPPVPWSEFSKTSSGPRHHLARVIGVAASVVLIALATILWAAPSAGTRYQGSEAQHMGHSLSASVATRGPLR